MRLEMPTAAGRTPEGGWWGGTARLSNVALPHFVRGTHETFSRTPCLSLGLGIKRDCVTWCVEAGECGSAAGDARCRRSNPGRWWGGESLWNVFSQISTVGLKPVGRPGGLMWQPFTTPCTYICWGRPLRTRVSGGSNPPRQVPFFGRPIQYPCRVAGSGAGGGVRQGGASSSVADLRVELE